MFGPELAGLEHFSFVEAEACPTCIEPQEPREPEAFEHRMQEQIRRVDAGAAEYSDFADIMKRNQPVSSRLMCFSFCEGILTVSSFGLLPHPPHHHSSSATAADLLTLVVVLLLLQHLQLAGFDCTVRT